MKLELFDVDEFVELNKLKEVTSPVIFERGGIPNPDGLISNEIFGVNTKSRKETFAYIDLGNHFFHPHIYKVLRRIFRNIDKIVSGEEYYSISENGNLVKDPNGDTGIEWLYENWNKIKWNGNGGMSTERANLINKTKKDMIFITKQIVIPAFYRDISTSEAGTGAKIPDIDQYYVNLIRSTSLIKNRDMFAISFHSTNYNIQQLLVTIYDHFKNMLDKKNGLLRKYLMGKNVDFCARVVISTPLFIENDPKNNIVDFQHTLVPVAQVCVLAFPFMVNWVKNFFEREFIETKNLKQVVVKGDTTDDYVEIANPESFYSDTYIRKSIDRYVKDPSSRYDEIPVPLTDGRTASYVITGYSEYSNGEDDSPLMSRPMTWTDLLFIAANDIVKNKHIMVTRYPILDNFGIFISRINVGSTRETRPMKIFGEVYKWYPVIDTTMPKHIVANNFIDVLRFSNAYLKGLDGDYDGDQVTGKIIWTQEANEECEKLMASKMFLVSPNGANMRTMDIEGIQTLYTLTKDPVE